MKFLPFILRNAFRNKRRTILTILSITMSLFLITTLRTLLNQLENPPSTPQAAKRVIVRHQTSLGNPLPIAFKAQIQKVPGVEHVSTSQWFGGYYKDPSIFFAQFAVDAESFCDVWPEFELVTSGSKEAFIKERTAGLVGTNLAERFGWKVGDRVTIEGQIFPMDVEFIVRGLVRGGGSENVVYFRWDYFNELLGNENFSGTYTVMARSEHDLPAIAETIDNMFISSTAPTKTETERGFILGFMTMLGNVRALIVSISTVVLFTIILVAANTMAMSIRERKAEIAILKTLGFAPGHILAMMIFESAVIALLGGLIGSIGARFLYNAVDLGAMSMGFLQDFRVSWSTVGLAAAISLMVAFTSTFIPAWSASRLSIAQAVRQRGE
ncbi:MAG: ABC transporter permease [Acidobacteria bacterium]|nr:ABC transporter permease [Acidobacteriota bacterium]